MNICFVGYGAIAGVHAAVCRRLGHTLHTVVGRVAEGTAAFANHWGFLHSTLSLEEALARPEIQAVLICSPSHLHEAQALHAIEAGKHVLVEIPLAMSYAGGRRVAELSRRQRSRVMVAHTQRFMPAVRFIREEVAAGKLDVLHILARFLLFRRRNVSWTGRARSWTDNLLWHHSGHTVDTCLWLLGMPAVADLEVNGQIGPVYAQTGVPMDLDIEFRARGTLVNIAMSYHSEDTGMEYLVIGAQRTLRIAQDSLLHGAEVLYDARASEEYLAVELQDREFFAAIAASRAPSVSPDDVLPSLEILQRVQDQNGGRCGPHGDQSTSAETVV